DGRAITAGEPAFERRTQPGRVLGALGRGAEALREPQKARIGEIAGDQAVAVLFGLDAAHIAESAVGEHYRNQRNAMMSRGRELVRRKHEAAVARDGEDRHVRPRMLDAERRRVAPAEIVLIAGRNECARPVYRE